MAMPSKRYRKRLLVYLGWILGVCELPGKQPPKQINQTYILKVPGSLKDKLKANRSRSQSGGSGDQYWESVMKVVEQHYGKSSIL